MFDVTGLEWTIADLSTNPPSPPYSPSVYPLPYPHFLPSPSVSYPPSPPLLALAFPHSSVASLPHLPRRTPAHPGPPRLTPAHPGPPPPAPTRPFPLPSAAAPHPWSTITVVSLVAACFRCCHGDIEDAVARPATVAKLRRSEA